MAMTTEDRLAEARLDPALVYARPADIVDDDNLANEDKIELLRRWEYDALENQVADEEGFPARTSGNLLDEVVAALHTLGAAPDIEHSPPTKQRGV